MEKACKQNILVFDSRAPESTVTQYLVGTMIDCMAYKDRNLKLTDLYIPAFAKTTTDELNIIEQHPRICGLKIWRTLKLTRFGDYHKILLEWGVEPYKDHNEFVFAVGTKNCVIMGSIK